ncbi:MAG: CRISPR-associated protein Cas5 [Anaerolineae bacterium]
MQVLKVVAEGLTASFRYPHFMQGVQPSFEMPPPATLYGHICSALGEWVDPDGIQFAIHFAFAARFDDIEHVHLVAPGTGKAGKDFPYPVATQGIINPFTRTILFRPRLTLYLNRPDWADAFRHPRYAVGLGRSQDLFTYTQVQVMELERAAHAYLEHTLLPYPFARRTARGVVVLMPRFLDYQRNRYPHFQQYVVLHHRVHADQLLRVAGEPEPTWWVDPTSPEADGDRLGLVFLSWVGERDETFQLA